MWRGSGDTLSSKRERVLTARIVVRLGPVGDRLAAEGAALPVLAARPLLAEEQRRMVAIGLGRVFLLANCVRAQTEHIAYIVA